MRTRINGLKRLPLAIAVLGSLYGAAALAQTAPVDETEQAEQAEDDEDVVELGTITVTGSLIKRQEYDSVSPVQVVTTETSRDIGLVETAEFLQMSSVAAGELQINNQFSGFVVEGGTGVQTLSLRGLGAQRTLVLLNGKRPGPAGTRGQVAAFDLNVMPSSILQRAEILKDGASSIYGSDAVAGVVNLITRRDIDSPEISFNTRVPFEGGGEVYTIAGAMGWDIGASGNATIAGEWFLHEPLLVGDRDFFSCSEDLIKDSPGGTRIDREDRSILAGTSLAGCNNLYANTVIDAVFGRRYIPSPDGSTIGLIPGYRPRVNPTYSGGGQAYYEDVLNFDFYGSTQIIDRQERGSLYAGLDFALGDVTWSSEFLYNNRKTNTHRYRQFFPLVGGATAMFGGFGYANDPTYAAPVPSGIAQPVMPFPSDQEVEVDYYYVSTGFDGYLGDNWSWGLDASYTYSDGRYSSLGIVASRSGDVRFDPDAPLVDYFDPAFLSGERMADLVATVGEWNTGNTIYDQFVVTGIVTGDLYELPAGPLAAAFGAEYRSFSIDDQPSDLSRNSDLWGQSSAQVTKGDDAVKELFAEFELPLLRDQPGFDSLTLNVSGRIFDYDSIDGTDSVWKVGLGWQVNPALLFRATKGTSYRAPGLFELYLGDQTAFASQFAIDPCINWGEKSTNVNLQTNCAAQGIPDDYTGAASSATIVSGGGAGILESETSEAFTVGVVITPVGSPFSMAFDYFSIEVNDQISQLGAGAILGGCYSADVFPNSFCNLFDRNPGSHPTEPYKITEVRDQYININRQQTNGYDLLFRYDDDYSFGNVEVEGQFTYTLEDIVQLFSTAEESGFASSDSVGSIGRPQLVGNIRTALNRGDWTYTWNMNYVDGTKHLTADPELTYFGFPNARRDIWAESRLYHAASVRYEQPNWTVTVGVRNIFDTAPPFVSSGVASRYGNVPAFATQYDWYGRSAFASFRYKF